MIKKLNEVINRLCIAERNYHEMIDFLTTHSIDSPYWSEVKNAAIVSSANAFSKTQKQGYAVLKRLCEVFPDVLPNLPKENEVDTDFIRDGLEIYDEYLNTLSHDEIIDLILEVEE